jgi:4-diphosphocytidyl-2-C-methyl-D-erythritol kinase
VSPPAAASQIALPAFAKLNLALEVVGRRDDGFHDLCSVVVMVDWHDLVSVRIDRGSGWGHPVVTVDGPTAHADMADAGGLAATAAAALSDQTSPGSRTPGSLAVHIHKRLPVAAGLGGGSADAAAILRALAALAETPSSTGSLLQLAARLGSDVPAALVGGTLLVEGSGQRLTPIAAPGLHLAIAVAGSSSTRGTYAALSDSERKPDGRAKRVVAALAARHTPQTADLGSALEPAAARTNPALATALATLRAALPDTCWHLTGSGGAAFALAVDAFEADRLAGRARAAGFPARACRTLTAPLLSTTR